MDRSEKPDYVGNSPHKSAKAALAEVQTKQEMPPRSRPTTKAGPIIATPEQSAKAAKMVKRIKKEADEIGWTKFDPEASSS
ncbi:hypothetical protein JL100_012150 [Skermanella mucosa]|uniref:hypothetical protein n=1 Tax=Skermanella mucosa TaxID=1789672 RepID=UPI00192B3B01|nr:hypothetical protein [Skermanella mucosa]UEM23444.1 hypothetical protein JL100_012150 [Skermanella mucosa]